MLMYASIVVFLLGAYFSIRARNYRPFAVLFTVAFTLAFGMALALLGRHATGIQLRTALVVGCIAEGAIVAWAIYQARGARVSAILMVPICVCAWIYALLIAGIVSGQVNWI